VASAATSSATSCPAPFHANQIFLFFNYPLLFDHLYDPIGLVITDGFCCFTAYLLLIGCGYPGGCCCR
jgi:hypothetical protein